MKLTTTTLTLLATFLSAAHSLPTDLLVRQFPLPTCGAESCLTDTPGLFSGCAPGNLGCLCSLSQSEVQCYANTVAPCLDGDVGKGICTAGAIFQYKDILASVCASDHFENKVVTWPTPTAEN